MPFDLVVVGRTLVYLAELKRALDVVAVKIFKKRRYSLVVTDTERDETYRGSAVRGWRQGFDRDFFFELRKIGEDRGKEVVPRNLARPHNQVLAVRTQKFPGSGDFWAKEPLEITWKFGFLRRLPCSLIDLFERAIFPVSATISAMAPMTLLAFESPIAAPSS